MRNYVLNIKTFNIKKIIFLGLFCFLFFSFFCFVSEIIASEEEDALLEDDFLAREVSIALEPPTITDIPKRLEIDENLFIRGVSDYPNITIRIFVQQENDEPKTTDIETDNNGNWSYLYDQPIREGSYAIWAIAIDDRGNQSPASERFDLAVSSENFFRAFLKSPVLAIIFLLIIIIMLFFYIVSQKRKLSFEKRSLRNKTEKIKKVNTKIFKALREEAKEQIPNKNNCKKIKEALTVSEKLFKSEIEDIEKKLK